MLNPNTAEWLVLAVDPDGQVRSQSDRGETTLGLTDTQAHGQRYTLTQAQVMAASLGPPWKVNHHQTLVPPDQHEAWLKGRGIIWSP
jgi:hypothetical protein